MIEESKITDEVSLQENRNLQILQRSLAGALKEVFGEYTESQRFVDLKRVPLLCKTTEMIIKNQEDEKRERERLVVETARILQEHRRELNNNLKDIKEKIDGSYVTREMLEAKVGLPIKLVYGACGIILVAVLSSLVYLIIRK